MEIVFSSFEEGHEVLAIATGMSERDAARSKLPQEIIVPALVIDGEGTLTHWVAEGTYCDKESGNLVIWGPAFPGVTLLASARGGDSASAWTNLHRVASLIKKAHLAGSLDDDALRSIATGGPEAIICGADGRILILPADLYIRALASHGGLVTAENRAFWVHPDTETLNTGWSFAFLMGTVAYRIVTGREPFTVPDQSRISGEDGSVEEQIARNIGQGIFEPVELARWNVKKQAADSINALISSKVAASTDTLLAFGPDYASLFDSTKDRSQAPSEFFEKKISAKRRRDATIERESFIRRHRRSFVISSIIAFFTLLLAGVYIHDMSEKPTTKGMSADSVIRGYYAGIASLDQEIPAAYAAKGVKADYADMLSNLFVASKMRETFERTKGIVSPQEIFRGEDPDKKSVFGISRLTLDILTEDASDVRYGVSYYLWLPVAPPTEDDANNASESAGANMPVNSLSVYRYRETVTVSRIKERWQISSIVPIERTLVAEGADAILSRIATGRATNEPWAPLPGETIE